MKTVLRQMSTLAMVAAVTLAGASCAESEEGSGDKNYGDPLTASSTHKQSAQSAVTATDRMRALTTDDAGDEAAISETHSVYGNLNVMVSAKQTSAAMGGLHTAALTAVKEGALEEGCYTEQDGTVTYDQCEWGAGTIDGTISYAEPDLTVDLTMDISGTRAGAGGTITIVEKGTLSFTADAITGNLEFSSTSGVAAGFDSNNTVTAFYDVQLDADGCPNGGTLEVHSVTSVSGEGIPAGAAGGNADIWVKAEFGPACGDVTLY